MEQRIGSFCSSDGSRQVTHPSAVWSHMPFITLQIIYFPSKEPRWCEGVSHPLLQTWALSLASSRAFHKAEHLLFPPFFLILNSAGSSGADNSETQFETQCRKERSSEKKWQHNGRTLNISLARMTVWGQTPTSLMPGRSQQQQLQPDWQSVSLHPPSSTGLVSDILLRRRVLDSLAHLEHFFLHNCSHDFSFSFGVPWFQLSDWAIWFSWDVTIVTVKQRGSCHPLHVSFSSSSSSSLFMQWGFVIISTVLLDPT